MKEVGNGKMDRTKRTKGRVRNGTERETDGEYKRCKKGGAEGDKIKR
jgi:hypothetical protein